MTRCRGAKAFISDGQAR